MLFVLYSLPLIDIFELLLATALNLIDCVPLDNEYLYTNGSFSSEVMTSWLI